MVPSPLLARYALASVVVILEGFEPLILRLAAPVLPLDERTVVLCVENRTQPIQGIARFERAYSWATMGRIQRLHTA